MGDGCTRAACVLCDAAAAGFAAAVVRIVSDGGAGGGRSSGRLGRQQQQWDVYGDWRPQTCGRKKLKFSSVL